MGGKKSKKNARGVAVVCWLAGFFILLIIFLVKLDDIKSNLKATRFFERVFGSTPTFIENYEEKKPVVEPLPEEDVVITLNTVEPPRQQTPPPAQEGQPAVAVQPDEPQSVPAVPPVPESAETPSAVPQTPPAPTVPPAPAVATSTAKLFFVSIDNDGSVTRKEMARTITKNDSPLTGNIRLLLEGPSMAERSKGCRSLIPDGTRLLSATVRDGVATLNFSEEFEFNQRVGVEGYIAQLMQIVYTATEFPTVNSVQFLIDGVRKEYLGSEGVWIGSPLSRSSF